MEFSISLHRQWPNAVLWWPPMATGRRDDETGVSPTILKSENARLKRICDKKLKRAPVTYLVRLMIGYGLENIDQVLAWYGIEAKGVADLRPGDELDPDPD